MTKGLLNSLTNDLDELCVEELGDPITYLIGGTVPVKDCYAFVDHSDKTEPLAGSQLTDQDIWIELLKRDVAQPAPADRIKLPQVPGVTFAPRDWRRNRSGRMWHIYLKLVRA